ncbi:hypothetical protein J43TS9_57600 [Paenibacillus cineris]|nr:hypothetical protein J43TS9_57600 [Paenibacillus cineris]
MEIGNSSRRGSMPNPLSLLLKSKKKQHTRMVSAMKQPVGLSRQAVLLTCEIHENAEG